MSEHEKYDYLEPIEVADGVHWVGLYDEAGAFHSNPYLLVDHGEAVLFDPAGVTEYPKVASKVFSVVDPAQVSYIVLQHQDPDLCAAVPMFEQVIPNPNLTLVTHSRARVLIQYYGVKSKFYDVDLNDFTLTLKSGRKLRFLTTPFCHFPAAIATYDEKQKLLFSADIFGAISKDWHLYAREGYERSMESFHVGYMASQRHLCAVMERFERLEIDKILPQHGSIIQGPMVGRCISFLKTLRCGIDANIGEREMYGWIPAQR